MVVALKPLHDHAHIKRIVVSTYQSTSGAGKQAMDELFEHTRAIYMNAREEPRSFAKTIAFNVVPQIGPFDTDGSTGEEVKMVRETQRILDPESPGERHLRAGAHLHRPCGGRERRVPRPHRGGGGARAAPDRTGRGGGRPPLRRRLCHPGRLRRRGRDLVSRFRRDPTVANGLCLWVVSDNLRKGAALNAVQIAEDLIANHLGSA